MTRGWTKIRYKKVRGKHDGREARCTRSSLVSRVLTSLTWDGCKKGPVMTDDVLRASFDLNGRA